jgi:hypothetical protein
MKAIRIEIEYDDGDIRFAEGDAARQIMEWWLACETMNTIHGASYHGPKFTIKDKQPVSDRDKAIAFQKRITGEATTEPGKVWWASVQFPDVLAIQFAFIRAEEWRLFSSQLRYLEEKLPCGHRGANEVGDDRGAPYCEICRAVENLQKTNQELMDNAITFADLEKARAQGRLEEFDHMKANRPISPAYWDEHHRKDLEEQAHGGT